MHTSKQRYGIRKGINGVVSVLLGLTLVASVGSSVVSAEEAAPKDETELVEIDDSLSALVPKELHGKWVSVKGDFVITDTMYITGGEGFEIVNVDVKDLTYTLSYQTMGRVVDLVLTIDKTGEVPTLTVGDVVFTLDKEDAVVVEEGDVVGEWLDELDPTLPEEPETTWSEEIAPIVIEETEEPEVTTATPEETTKAPEVTTQAPVAPITTVAPVAQVTTVAPTTTTVANNGTLAEAGDPVSLVALGLGLSAVAGGASFLRKKEDA